MIGGRRVPFPSFAIDRGPGNARLERCIDEEMIDAHAVVLVKISGAIIPPCIPARLGMAQPVSIDKTSAAEARERCAFRFRDMCSAMAGGGIPYLHIFRRNTQNAPH